MTGRWLLALAVGAATWSRPSTARCGDDTHDDSEGAAEADEGQPKQDKSTWNAYDGRYFTARFGGGLLIDYATFSQDTASAEQMSLHGQWKLRDFRLLLNGKLKFAPRLSYTISYMWDAADDKWRFRQTGIAIDLPELNGSLFIGRSKEGFSTLRIMVGYNGWTLERAAANDSFLPILADGVKLTATGLGGHIVYNVGEYDDFVSDVQPFNKHNWQVVGRLVWLPLPTDGPTLLHLCAEARWGAADNGLLQFKSRPESFVAQSFAVDTGAFEAIGAATFGAEVYYQSGPLILGGEYYANKVDSPDFGNPLFHGGFAIGAYLLGGTRPYNYRGAYFEAVEPTRDVLHGGLGALEFVLNVSYVDLTSGTLDGGKFWKITPMANWYLSKNLRLAAGYGYSGLDRMGLDGRTQYFQTRIQLSLN